MPQDRVRGAPSRKTIISKRCNRSEETTDMTNYTKPLSTSRQFTFSRRVALSDTNPAGRLRIDACARYLQDLAAFDAIEADISEFGNWVLRQNSIEISSLPTYGTALDSKTYLTGSGRAWIQRTSIISDAESKAELIVAKALWVLTHSENGSPISIPTQLYKIYGPLATQHKIPIRDSKRPPLPEKVTPIDWQIRYSDQDILAHLNNATYLEVLEEVLHRKGIDLPTNRPATCTVTYRESTSYTDQSDVFFQISEIDSNHLVEVFFAKEGSVRTNMALTLPT